MVRVGPAARRCRRPSIVKIKLDVGPEITSSITKEAADDLGLAAGSKVVALIKSTEVALATE